MGTYISNQIEKSTQTCFYFFFNLCPILRSDAVSSDLLDFLPIYTSLPFRLFVDRYQLINFLFFCKKLSKKYPKPAVKSILWWLNAAKNLIIGFLMLLYYLSGCVWLFTGILVQRENTSTNINNSPVLFFIS